MVIYLCANDELTLNDPLILPTGLEHVLSKTLCGTLAATGLTQIRKYAATEESKSFTQSYLYTDTKVDVIYM